MPARIWITNTTTDAKGGRIPNLPAGTSWVGSLYRKTGNVYKYLVKTPWTVSTLVVTGTDPVTGEATGELQEVAHPDAVDLTGEPGVVGPITPEQIAAALEADGDDGTFRGFHVDDVPSWAIDGTP